MKLTDSEVAMLIVMLTEGTKHITETDVERAIEWAEEIRSEGDEMDLGFLGLVLKGMMSLNVEGEEPLFALTQKGFAEAEGMLKRNLH